MNIWKWITVYLFIHCLVSACIAGSYLDRGLKPSGFFHIIIWWPIVWVKLAAKALWRAITC